MNNAITDVPGIKVGHYTDLEAATGCTVILCPEGAVGGVDVRGPAPGTRETDLLRPGHLVERVHAVCLSGGSAFGLAAAEGVMRYLEERDVGFDVKVAKVPIVPAAILFDLTIGSAKVRPDAKAGYQACLAASEGPVAEGNVGAGTGATVGKLLGPKFATKSGLGTASQKIGQDIIVGAIMAVNAFGDVIDPQTGEILAGTRKPVVGGFLNTAERMKGDLGQTILGLASTTDAPARSLNLTASRGEQKWRAGASTIGVVATDARLTKEQANVVAQMAQDGLARAIRPAHTMFDGDTIFALSLGEKEGDVSAIGSAAADVVAQAIVRAVMQAEALHGLPAHRDLGGNRKGLPLLI